MARRVEYMYSILLFLATPAFLHGTASPANAAEEIIVRLILNQEERGDFFAILLDDGDILLAADDLESLDLNLPPGQLLKKQQVSLRQLEGIDFEFDLSTLTVEITALPIFFDKQVIDFSSEQLDAVYVPQDTSLFFNYSGGYSAGDDFDFTGLNLSGEVGWQYGGLLLLSNGVYSKNDYQDTFTRLQTSLTYDDRNSLNRFIIGDYFTTSWALGSSFNLGGVSLSKVFTMKPDYVYYPTLKFGGQSVFPTEAKIYLNGILIRTAQLSPGEFELENITPYGTAGNLKIMLKDSLGREQVLDYPYYYADRALLKDGLHEYAYNLGFIREDYGELSNRYGEPAFSAFHRYGLNDAITLGAHTEVTGDTLNFGSGVTFLAGKAGLVSLSLAGSTEEEAGSGVAGIATYSYRNDYFTAGLSFAGYSEGYRTAAEIDTDELTEFSFNSGLSYGIRDLGTLSLDYGYAKNYHVDARQQANVTYSKNIASNVSFTASYRRIEDNESENQFLFTLNFTPLSGISVSSRVEQYDDHNETALSISKNAPVGEGFGFRADLSRSDWSGEESWIINPHLQYNGPYGIYEADFEERISEGDNSGSYNLSASGALVYVDGVFGLARPVYDSFALVNVGDIEGVKVLMNSQEVGRTNKAGNLIVPSLSSYNNNQLKIDTENIPFDYLIAEDKKLISPSLRSGACIPFVAGRMQPVFGSLALRVGMELVPLEFLEVTSTIAGREFTFPTGSGGEFDIDLSQSANFDELLAAGGSGCSVDSVQSLLKPGSYQASTRHDGQRIDFELKIPESDDPFIDLGQIIIEEKNSIIPGGA